MVGRFFFWVGVYEIVLTRRHSFTSEGETLAGREEG